MLSCKANPVLVQCLRFPHSGNTTLKLWDPCSPITSTGATPASDAQGPVTDQVDPLQAPCLSSTGTLSGSPAPHPGPSTQDMLRESHEVCA